MGSNKSSLDRYSFADGSYLRNIYAQASPGYFLRNSGDVGNDMAALQVEAVGGGQLLEQGGGPGP